MRRTVFCTTLCHALSARGKHVITFAARTLDAAQSRIFLAARAVRAARACTLSRARIARGKKIQSRCCALPFCRSFPTALGACTARAAKSANLCRAVNGRGCSDKPLPRELCAQQRPCRSCVCCMSPSRSCNVPSVSDLYPCVSAVHAFGGFIVARRRTVFGALRRSALSACAGTVTMNQGYNLRNRSIVDRRGARLEETRGGGRRG